MDKLKDLFTRYYINIVKGTYTNFKGSFEGRARREEYWFFILFNWIVGFLIGFIDGILDTEIDAVIYSIGLFGTLYNLAVLLPSIALATRRMHDINKSGWWQLLVLLPIVGWIWFFILTVLEGTRGPNRFGEDPITDRPEPVVATNDAQ